MSYLKNNNNKVVVDAILTKYGKTKLATQGSLDIVKFAVADDEIDYALYNNLHPDGTDYYNSAIVNLPTLQALPEEYLSMKYPLFSITSGNVDAISNLELNLNGAITGSGIYNYTVYPIAPSFNPEPGDITRTYFVAKVTIPGPNSNPPPIPSDEVPKLKGSTFQIGQTNDGLKFVLGATINDEIGITNEIIAARGFYKDTTKYKYAVGHGFTFQVQRFGRNPVSLPLTITPFGINAAPKTIIVQVVRRDVAPINVDIDVQGAG